jgi:hypothetical protein
MDTIIVIAVLFTIVFIVLAMIMIFTSKVDKKVVIPKVWVDSDTSFMWQTTIKSKPVRFIEAKKVVKELNRSKYAGYSDWRVPNKEELASLIKKDAQKDEKKLKEPFCNYLNVTTSSFWTTIEYDTNPQMAWAVNLVKGIDFGHHKDDRLQVLCLRDHHKAKPKG